MKILDRYLARELIGPFLIGVLGFILVLAVDLLFTMADMIINKGVPLLVVLKLMFYKLPSLLVLTFPVSTLFATSMALGRLSHDNEIVAMRTSGITLFRISASILVMGMVVSLTSYFTNEKLVPSANQVSSQIIREIIMKQPLPSVSENVFFKDNQNRYYYARRVDNKTKVMENVMVYEVIGEKFPRVILADRASFQGKEWELEKGMIHKYDEKGYLAYEATFEHMKLTVTEDFLAITSQKTTQDMDRRELSSTIEMLNKGGASTHALVTELYLKYSIPFTCFVFALVGIPFSLPSPRAGRAWGIILTIVFMFTFYVFASIFRSLGRGGILPPEAAAFTPQVFFTIIGGGLLAWESLGH